MAERLEGDTPKAKKAKIGDNSDRAVVKAIPPEQIATYFKNGNRKTDDYETVGGEFRADMKNLHERFATKHGIKIKTARRMFKKQRDAMKEAQRYDELEPSEKDEQDRIVAAAAVAEQFKGTPFGEWARREAERIPAEPRASTQAEAGDEEAE